MTRTKNVERARDGSSFPPIGASEGKKNERLRKCGQILLTKKKRQSMFSLSVGSEDKSDGLEIRSDTLLPKIYLCWQSESGDFDSVERHALARVINILNALGHDDKLVNMPLLTPETKDEEGSKLSVGKQTESTIDHPSKPQKSSSLVIDLTGDDDMIEVPSSVKSGHGVSFDDCPASDGKKRSFTITSHEQGSSSCQQPKKIRAFSQPSEHRDPYHDQLTNVGQKIANGFTEVTGRAVEETLDLQLDSAVREKCLLQVDEIFHGQNWKTLDQRRRVRTIVEQFRYLQDMFVEPDLNRGPDPKGSINRLKASWQAGTYLRTKGYCFYENCSIEGAIPGIEVGDSFECRQELFLLLIHRQFRAGIDFIPAKDNKYTDNQGNSIAVAVSVVVSGGYKDDEYRDGTLIYTGQGGNQSYDYRRRGREKDQELVRGNLALKNSCDYGVPVRVTLGSKGKTYVYMGLFDVKLYYQEPGENGFKLWKFKLVKRIHQDSHILGCSMDSV